MKVEVPKELLVAIARGDGIAFVGSGPSKAAGFPDWPGLIKLMMDWCIKQNINLPNKSDIEQLIRSNKLLLAADALRANMGEINYYAFLQEVFDQPDADLTEFHQLFAQILFAGAGTTNYETLVERGFRQANPGEPIAVFTQVDHEQLGTMLQSKRFFVLKAHGTIERPETIVLGTKDYANLIHKNVGYRTFLKALFLDRAVLFLGFGLNDPELLLLLEELREIFEGHTPIHHALIDVSKTTETEQRNFESHYGIRIIPYTPSSADHPEVTEFLRQTLAKLPKYILAHTMNHAMKPAKSVLNADSHYRLVMNSDNEFVIREKYEGASKEKPLEFRTELRFDPKKPEDREAHETYKKFLATGEPITIKSPHVAKFVPPEVLAVLMPDRIDEMQLSMGPVIGQKSLIARAIFEANDGEKIVLENIEFKNIQSGTEQMILSNEHQAVPWKFRQVIRFDERESQANFSLDSVNVPISQSVKALKFCRAFSRGGLLKLESSETDLQLSHANIPAGAYPSPSENWIKICEALELIQRKTGTLFRSPESVSTEDARGIALVVQILETGRVTAMPPHMNFTVREAQELLPKFASGVTMALQNYFEGWVSIIFNHELHLGPVLISCDKMSVTPEDRVEAEKRILNRAPSDVIQIRMTPVSTSTLEAKFIAWLPSEEAETIRNMPFVKSTSLKNLLNLLFDTVIETERVFDVEEFIRLLAEARAESIKEGVVLSPLSLSTPSELEAGFAVIFERLEPEQRAILIKRLIDEGWINKAEAAASSASPS